MKLISHKTQFLRGSEIYMYTPIAYLPSVKVHDWHIVINARKSQSESQYK